VPRAPIKALTVYFEALAGEPLVPGIIVAVQTFGDRINFRRHPHLPVTEGGMDQAGTFHRLPHLGNPISRPPRSRAAGSQGRREDAPRINVDFIVSELEFYREGRSEKHLRDIAGIIKISGEELDLGYIASVTQGKGLREIWEELLEGARK
jgi:hypothetical protein